jgi:pimeloyl-ACP methyl ester carboxylesterase
MPAIKRPDGVEIHWEAKGNQGPLVLIVHQILWSYPGVYAGLIADLARDHRVVVYDPRGCGQSSRAGPYDVETDAGDLLAVVETTGGGPVAIGVGYGYNLVARVAAERPDLIYQVLSVAPAAAAVLPRKELRGSEVMAASDSVIEMILKMLETDPRAALHMILAATNPELADDQLRERVDRAQEYLSPEAALDRAQAWLQDDASEYARALGDRLWILHGEAEPLFEGAGRTRVADLYPSAHVEQLAGGLVSQPDHMAARVRGLTGVEATA